MDKLQIYFLRLTFAAFVAFIVFNRNIIFREHHFTRSYKKSSTTLNKQTPRKNDVVMVTSTKTNETFVAFATEKIATRNSSQWSKSWPRVNLQDCSHREFMNRGINSPESIKNLHYPQTGLVSFPGSGNTWARFLIEQGTGLWTGSVYMERALYKGGFGGEMESDRNSTVVVKSHERNLYQNERVILIIRNPYRALVSEFHRRNLNPNVSHTAGVKMKYFKTGAWKYYVRQFIGNWVETNINVIRKYIGKSKPLTLNENPFAKSANHWTKILLVSYERLLKDPKAEVQRIVEFLGLPVFRNQCLQENLEGNFRRKSESIQHISCYFNDSTLQNYVENAKKKLKHGAETIGAGNILVEIEEFDKNINCDENS